MLCRGAECPWMAADACVGRLWPILFSNNVSVVSSALFLKGYAIFSARYRASLVLATLELHAHCKHAEHWSMPKEGCLVSMHCLVALNLQLLFWSYFQMERAESVL